MKIIANIAKTVTANPGTTDSRMVVEGAMFNSLNNYFIVENKNLKFAKKFGNLMQLYTNL